MKLLSRYQRRLLYIGGIVTTLILGAVTAVVIHSQIRDYIAERHADVDALVEAVLSRAEFAEDELARPFTMPPTRQEAVHSLTHAARPDPDALRELASLADEGGLSDIKDWCRKWSLLQPDCQPFLDTVQEALANLDFPRIQALAAPQTSLTPESPAAA